jgi:hypothetical protein
LSFNDYFVAQQGNLDQIRRLPHFVHLIEPVSSLYEVSISALAPDKATPLYAKLLLVCHKALMSAAALIGRGQPDDSAGVTRRAIEAACLARAIKHDKANLKRWISYENRLARWEAREQGRKPRPLSPEIAYPPCHKTVDWLRGQIGVLSDAAVHFTPEFYDRQDWRIEHKGETVGLSLQYFEPSQRAIERALIALANVSLHILDLFNECFDNAFHGNARWRDLRAEIQRVGHALAKTTGLPVEGGGADGPAR